MAQSVIWDLWWKYAGDKRSAPALTTKKPLRRERPHNVAISNCFGKIKLRAVARWQHTFARWFGNALKFARHSRWLWDQSNRHCPQIVAGTPLWHRQEIVPFARWIVRRASCRLLLCGIRSPPCPVSKTRHFGGLRTYPRWRPQFGGTFGGCF